MFNYQPAFFFNTLPLEGIGILITKILKLVFHVDFDEQS